MQAVTEHPGDCFVILSSDGRYLTGAGEWMEEFEKARRFDGPRDAYSTCESVALALRNKNRLACDVAYVPRSEIRVA